MRRRDFVIASLATIPLATTLATPRALAASMPVVLELFTSQGCSSCPPADAFLGELTRQPGVIGLAWHVDYWNSLGWRDPYARPEWTDRQKSYARRLNEEVYTPAMVVNGAAMVVGSDKAAVRQAIDDARKPLVAVVLRRSIQGLEAEIGPLSDPVPPDSMTGMLVTYDPIQATDVAAGENQGHRLTEYRVVRDVMAVDRITPRLVLPPVAEHRGAVLLLRNEALRVIGAADLAPATS